MVNQWHRLKHSSSHQNHTNSHVTLSSDGDWECGSRRLREGGNLEYCYSRCNVPHLSPDRNRHGNPRPFPRMGRRKHSYHVRDQPALLRSITMPICRDSTPPRTFIHAAGGFTVHGGHRSIFPRCQIRPRTAHAPVPRAQTGHTSAE